MNNNIKTKYREKLVSVIIPTYNRANLLDRAIKSVLAQSYQDFEIIVVDDGSTDNTKEIIENLYDNRIKYIRHDQNKGGACARNTGIKASSGQYIAFLDSDDEWLPEKLDKQISLFSNCSDSVGAVYCSHYTHDDISGRIWKEPFSDLKRGNLYNSLLNGWCPASTSFFVLARNVFEKSGLFDDQLPSFQDYDLWIRVAEHYEFEFIDEPLAIKHNHYGVQIASNLDSRTKGLDIFLAKWSDIIKKQAGENAYNNIRRMHLSPIYRNAIFDNILAGRRRQGIRYFINFWKLEHPSLRLVGKFFLAFIGGKKLLNLSRRIVGNFRQTI